MILAILSTHNINGSVGIGETVKTPIISAYKEALMSY